MSIILPIRIDGASVTCAAVLDDGTIYTETYTHTPDGKTSATPEKDDIARYAQEFSGLLTIREQPEPKKGEVEPTASYVDDSGNTLTAKQAEDAFKAAIPAEVAVDAVA